MSLSEKVKKLFRDIAIGGVILGSSIVVNSDVNLKSYYEKEFTKNLSYQNTIEIKEKTYEEKLLEIEKILDKIPTEGKDYFEEDFYRALPKLVIIAKERINSVYELYNKELEKALIAKKNYDYYENYKLVNDYGLDKFLENMYNLADFHQYTRDLLKTIDLKKEEFYLFQDYHREKIRTIIVFYSLLPEKHLVLRDYQKQASIIEYYSLMVDFLDNLQKDILKKSSEILHEF